MNCTACYLVKYCSVDCQKIPRKLHKKACKERAAELKDEKLYSQGHERPEGEFCPICSLAIPFTVDEHCTHSSFYSCCMKTVCNGCGLAGLKRGLGPACPFCRAAPSKNDEEIFARFQKRVAAKDPEALYRLGNDHFNGSLELVEKNESRAIELWSEAAELGSTKALFKMGVAYYSGIGVPLDEAKGIRCLESAAMQGDTDSRHMLGTMEFENKKYDRAVRHFLISAKMGYKDSLDRIKDMFASGRATKAQYAGALKGYQSAVQEMRSPERDDAATFNECRCQDKKMRIRKS